MSIGTRTVCHIAIIVKDIQRTVNNWTLVLGIDKPKIWNLPKPTEIPAYTNGKAGDYSDCMLSVIVLDNIVLEIIQPGQGDSPWKDHLDKHGEGFQHMGFITNNRAEAYEVLKQIGANGPYHVGYYPSGAYSFVDTKEALGVELNIKDKADYTDHIKDLLKNPGQELEKL